MSAVRRVTTRTELIDAAGSPDSREILVSDDIDALPMLRLSPGQSLRGTGRATLRFEAGSDGVQLSADNAVAGLQVVTDADRRAVYNDTTFAGFGRLELSRLAVTGCIRLLADGEATGGHVHAADVMVEAADALGYDQRPSGFGVEVVPGAFMVWNRQGDPAHLVTAELTGIGAGRAGHPVRGGGIFVAGTPGGGRTTVTRLETAEVHSDGGIAPGTADRISGGVFVVSGASVALVRNRGPVTTYGPNDMVLDNWGGVDVWQADARITSHGPSAIGFVNFGDLRKLIVAAPIETFGTGARGFNVYDGTLGEAEFDRVATHGDGAVGVQISKPVGRILVRHGIETFGGIGDSLVKGVVKQLAAIALSVKPGGSAREVVIDGGVTTHGPGVDPIELHGRIGELRISSGAGTTADGFDAI